MAEKLLEKGRAIGIFPQGGVFRSRLIKRGRKGVAVLAIKSAAPVVPCYIKATIDSSKKFNIMPKAFSPITLTFGRPLRFEKCLSRKIPPYMLEDALSKVLKAINDLGRSE